MRAERWESRSFHSSIMSRRPTTMYDGVRLASSALERKTPHLARGAGGALNRSRLGKEFACYGLRPRFTMSAPVRSICWYCFESLDSRSIDRIASTVGQYAPMHSSANTLLPAPRCRVVTLAAGRIAPVGRMVSDER
jgi:hypothetical protein